MSDKNPITFDRLLRAFRSLAERVKRLGDSATYIGNPDADGSWRLSISGSDLVIQRRIAGVWTTKQTITG